MNRMRRRRDWVLPPGILVGLAALSFNAHSAPPLGGAGDSLDVRADKLEVDLAVARAVLDGHVQLKRGDLVVMCPRVESRFDGSARLLWAHGFGPVTADVRGTHAEADDIEVDMVKQTLRLLGHVQVTRNGARLTADRGTIQFSTMHLTLEDVHGVLPGPLSPASSAPLRP